MTKFQTFVIGSPVGASSPFYSQTGSSTTPIHNGAFFVLDAYLTGSSIFASTFTPTYTCQPASTYDPPCLVTDSVLNQIATTSVPYVGYSDARNWTGQDMNWLEMKRDSTIADSSAIQASFKAIAAGTRMAYLANIEDKLAAGDVVCAGTQPALCPGPQPLELCMDTVTGVVVKDDSAITYIINKHRNSLVSIAAI